LLGACLNLARVRDAPDALPGFEVPLLDASALLSFTYIAAAVRWRDHAAMRRALRWLAPAGRMPLTNYIVQSIAMGALLSGWGLRLAAQATRLDLALGACAFYLVQLLVSRLVIARFGRGPLEALWRRATYGAAGRGQPTSFRPAGP